MQNRNIASVWGQFSIAGASENHSRKNLTFFFSRMCDKVEIVFIISHKISKSQTKNLNNVFVNVERVSKSPI